MIEINEVLSSLRTTKHAVESEQWESLCMFEDELRVSLLLANDSLERLVSHTHQSAGKLKQQRIFDEGGISQCVVQMELSANTLLNRLRTIHTSIDRYLIKRGYLKSDAGFLFFPPRSDEPYQAQTQRCFLLLQEIEMISEHAMDFTNLICLDLLTFHIELEKIRAYMKPAP